MTNETGEQRGPSAVVGQIEIWETHIGRECSEIPSDSESPFKLTIRSLIDDVAISMDDIPTGDTLLPFMRLRSFAGGGMFPHIPPILNYLAYDLEQYQGQIPPEYAKRKWPRIDGNAAFSASPDYSKTQVKVGKNNDEPKYSVTHIPDEDGDEEFLDIEVAQNGDVQITISNDYFDIKGTMVFKTSANGGKYPILAEAFTRIAEIIVAGQSPTPAS